jgi:hypothetical protein
MTTGHQPEDVFSKAILDRFEAEQAKYVVKGFDAPPVPSCIVHPEVFKSMVARVAAKGGMSDEAAEVLLLSSGTVMSVPIPT